MRRFQKFNQLQWAALVGGIILIPLMLIAATATVLAGFVTGEDASLFWELVVISAGAAALGLLPGILYALEKLPPTNSS